MDQRPKRRIGGSEPVSRPASRASVPPPEEYWGPQARQTPFAPAVPSRQATPPAQRKAAAPAQSQRRNREPKPHDDGLDWNDGTAHRMNPLLRLGLAMAATGMVLLACYLLVYANPFGQADKSGSAATPPLLQATAMPALSAQSPTQAPTHSPTQAPTRAPSRTTAAPAIQSSAIGNALPLLVNRNNPLPEDYKPGKLVKLIDVCPSDIVKIKGKAIEGEAEAVEALIRMLRAAVADGLGNWQISAGYRSIRYQQQLLDEKTSELMKSNGLSRANARSAALKTVALPGASEHHTGLAFDVTVPGTSFAGTKQAQWLAEHCHEYGYILRYQKHKEEITGILAEAWHFRYVGIPAALTMFENDWCLEEYVASFSN